MPHGGELRIETRAVELDEEYEPLHGEQTDRCFAVLTVSDTGIGMDGDVRARVFEPFFTTKEGAHGTGLGLSMVYGFVAQSGGHVELESAPGEGATFRLFFPLANETTQVEPRASSGETILVVEDVDVERTAVCDELERDGYDVLQARSGGEALRVLEETDRPVHLILTDVRMPGMGGDELAGRVRYLRPRSKVLFMTGGEVSLPDGDEVLRKPFSSDHLARRVRRILDKKT